MNEEYFTRADNIQVDPNVDAVSSASINTSGSSYEGNLAIMAAYVKETTGGDTFSIRTTETYPTGYRDTTDAAKEEQTNNARPELSSYVENMEDYDIIFVTRGSEVRSSKDDIKKWIDGLNLEQMQK